MDRNQRCIVRCSTPAMLDTLMRFAEDEGWSELRGYFGWAHYEKETAVLMVGTRPDGYAPEGYYQKHSDFADCLWFKNPYDFMLEAHKEEQKMNTERQKPPFDMAAYLAAVNVQSGSEKASENTTTGTIKIYAYALIKNSTGITEVSEDDFKASKQMQKARNVKHYIRTTITLDNSIVGTATCEAEHYDERQGILEAMANLMCQNFFDTSFEKFYRKLQKDKAAHDLFMRKCSLCGTVYETPEEAEKCVQNHNKNRIIRAERSRIRKIAKKEIKEAEYRERIEAMKAEIIHEESLKNVPKFD